MNVNTLKRLGPRRKLRISSSLCGFFASAPFSYLEIQYGIKHFMGELIGISKSKIVEMKDRLAGCSIKEQELLNDMLDYISLRFAKSSLFSLIVDGSLLCRLALAIDSSFLDRDCSIPHSEAAGDSELNILIANIYPEKRSSSRISSGMKELSEEDCEFLYFCFNFYHRLKDSCKSEGAQEEEYYCLGCTKELRKLDGGTLNGSEVSGRSAGLSFAQNYTSMVSKSVGVFQKWLKRYLEQKSDEKEVVFRTNDLIVANNIANVVFDLYKLADVYIDSLFEIDESSIFAERLAKSFEHEYPSEESSSDNSCVNCGDADYYMIFNNNAVLQAHDDLRRNRPFLRCLQTIETQFWFSLSKSLPDSLPQKPSVILPQLQRLEFPSVKLVLCRASEQEDIRLSLEQSIEMTRCSDGESDFYKIALLLEPGIYKYMFVIDNEDWRFMETQPRSALPTGRIVNFVEVLSVNERAKRTAHHNFAQRLPDENTALLGPNKPPSGEDDTCCCCCFFLEEPTVTRLNNNINIIF
eukprot:Nk52_evm3s248 gene=Nk52_evmTU3s248